jgi:hypothetical protein
MTSVRPGAVGEILEVLHFGVEGERKRAKSFPIVQDAFRVAWVTRLSALAVQGLAKRVFAGCLTVTAVPGGGHVRGLHYAARHSAGRQRQRNPWGIAGTQERRKLDIQVNATPDKIQPWASCRDLPRLPRERFRSVDLP